MKPCIFCQIIEGKIPSAPVYQDDNFIVIPDIHPSAPVHLLVIPKKHVTDFMDASGELLESVVNVTKKVIEQQHIKDFRLVTNGGGAAFVKHLHIHVMGKVAQDRNL